jgi:Fe-S protein assembly co-chaperone hscB
MTNPFAIFDLPVTFNIDLGLLSNRYLELQKSLHPDNFVTADSATQRQAMQKALEINDALKVLRDPVQRAEAIIAIETGNAVDPEQRSTQDVAFLMQQLEWREELEDIEQKADDATLNRFAQRIKQARLQLLNTLNDALTDRNWHLATQSCDKLRFIEKLNSEIERVEEHLFEL